MNEILPIGSVVLLKGGEKKTVIMGIMQFNAENPDKVYHYLGVPYPEGYMGNGSSYLFNHDDIREIIFRGYEDEEREQLFKVLDQIYQEVEKTVAESN